MYLIRLSLEKKKTIVFKSKYLHPVLLQEGYSRAVYIIISSSQMTRVRNGVIGVSSVIVIIILPEVWFMDEEKVFILLTILDRTVISFRIQSGASKSPQNRNF